jgi:TolB-like protein
VQDPQTIVENRASRPVPSPDEVRQQLARIIESPGLQSSKRRVDFLRYVVEETLANRASKLKGFTIAVEVFGRDETFDSQVDPIVRIEARRLRRDLDSYYVTAGSSDPIRIEIPKGSYVPRFERQKATTLPAGGGGASVDAAGSEQGDADGTSPSPMPSVPGRGLSRSLAIAALVVSVAALFAVGWNLLANKQSLPPAAEPGGPSVLVLPFEARGSGEYSPSLAAGLRQQLISDLMQFPNFRLFMLPMQSDQELTAGSSWPDVGATFAISGSVLEENGTVYVAAQLLSADTREVLWTGHYGEELVPLALMKLQQDLAGAIATEIGQPYGVVGSHLTRRLDAMAVTDMQSYSCVLRAINYRRNFSQDAHGPILECLDAAVRRDPQYSDAWAMLGWLELDAGRYEFTGPGNVNEHYEKAFAAASRAVSLAPNNTNALKALSSIAHYMGRYEESERLARRAIEINPYDPDTLAQLGWRLAVRGNFDEGIPVLRRAIERTANPPGWYYHLVAIHYYMIGDYDAMLDAARRSAADGSGVSQSLIAIASAYLGKRDETRQALALMSGHEPLMRDPGAYYRRHGSTDEIVDALETGLARARQVAGAT